MRLRPQRTCAVIGAGMTGLATADRLERQGIRVTIFEKSPRPGGRIAARRTRVATFNHGAPGIEAKAPEFVTFLERLGAGRGPDGQFRGAPDMRALFDPLIGRLRIRWTVTVARIEREAGSWIVQSEAGGRHGPFDTVVVTAPAPQTARLINGAHQDMSDEIGSVKMESVWTGMMSFDRPVALPRRSDGGQAVACEPDEAGAARSWVVHMGSDWTEIFLESDAPFAAVLMREDIEREAGERLPASEYLAAHRWRFARAKTPLGRPCLGCGETGLWAGGDWALGRTAEDAWRSGLAIAEQIERALMAA